MITQTSLSVANPFGRLPSHRLHFPVEGIVVWVHFPEDESSVSRQEIEYDIELSGQLMRTMGRLRNVPLALGAHGIDADQEIVLKPAQLVIPSGVLNLQTHGSCEDTDGDRVLVQFVHGSMHRPVITHVLSHPSRGRNDSGMTPRYAGKLELLTPGPRGGKGYAFGDGSAGCTAVDLKPVAGDRQVHHAINGTHMALDRNGDLFVDFKAHPDDAKGQCAGNVTKKLVVQNEGHDLLRLERLADGTVKLTLGTAATHNKIQVVVADGDASVALAEPLQGLYNQLRSKLNAFDSHTHSFTGTLAGTGVAPGSPLAGTATGTTGAPAPTVGAPAWDGAINSVKIKVPSN